MFWGLIMEPNKRYSQVVEKPFHISQAAMDISTGDNDPCQVMIVVDGKNFLVCTLQKNKTIQVPLDLYFKAGDSISFLTNGKCNVHLTGYLDPEFEEEPSDEEEEEEEEEEAPALVPAKNKRKLENSNEGTANKKAKQDKKAGKKAAAAESSDEDEDGEDQLQKFLDGEDIDTDDNDESFKVNTSTEATDSDEESDEEEEDDDDENEDESSEKADTTLDTSKDDSTVDVSKLTKSQKRRLKKKMQKQKEPQVNGVEKTKKEKPAEQPQKAEKKKPEAKKDAQEGDKKEKKSLSGGVFIEDLKVGTGAVAKPGKVVMVYYEGRLKQNNKMFDNCQKGPGFKFKLGAKEVISGWDVGVAGMKVGGKRKIVCPPAMAYGAKGSPPVIPPNSSLVFEVELKNVK
ncbi:46 kDa FK506-binding nuclear protein [Vanessa cardui]|uniref:46 kDa FK506-binding nuclear protein n=1 Tax=Vanessa cardui TaxID=171605 RepID=UPI001F13888C|nr:46 kDa FK506-binding nuclear protein [Vanessa cardui]